MKTLATLQYIGKLRLTGNGYGRTIRDAFQASLAHCVDKMWDNKFHRDNEDMFPLDLTNADLWSTYANCTDIGILVEEGKIVAYVDVHDGSNLDGVRTEKRWCAKFEVTLSTLKEFSHPLERAAIRKARYEYKRMLAQKERDWVTAHLGEEGLGRINVN